MNKNESVKPTDNDLTQKQNKLMNFHNENEVLLKELNKLKNDLILKTKFIYSRYHTFIVNSTKN